MGRQTRNERAPRPRKCESLPTRNHKKDLVVIQAKTCISGSRLFKAIVGNDAMRSNGPSKREAWHGVPIYNYFRESETVGKRSIKTGWNEQKAHTNHDREGERERETSQPTTGAPGPSAVAPSLPPPQRAAEPPAERAQEPERDHHPRGNTRASGWEPTPSDAIWSVRRHAKTYVPNEQRSFYTAATFRAEQESLRHERWP